MNRGILALVAVGLVGSQAAVTADAAIVLMSGSFAVEASGGTGSGQLQLAYDDVARTLSIAATFDGLSGTTNNAHIHCCTASPSTGTAGIALATNGLLPDFPLGVTSGAYVRQIDLSNAASYAAAFVTASGGTTAQAEARLISNLLTRQAYFNIHTTSFPGGEIRAFVNRVPEPGTVALLGAMLGIVGASRAAGRRR
jgi:hypothetical protein